MKVRKHLPMMAAIATLWALPLFATAFVVSTTVTVAHADSYNKANRQAERALRQAERAQNRANRLANRATNAQNRAANAQYRADVKFKKASNAVGRELPPK